MEDRKAIFVKQRSTVVIILIVAAIVLFILSFFIGNAKEQNLIRLIGYALIIATTFIRIYKGQIGYKPTREEIEERMFGKDNTGIEK